MAGREDPTRYGYSGLANLASSIRRSTALTVAMQISPPDSSIEQMLRTADRLADWIGGPAASGEYAARQSVPEPLGQPWGGDGPAGG